MKNKKKIAIISNQHRVGKDTLAAMLQAQYGLSFQSSSVAALEIFLYRKLLKDGFEYNNINEAFKDRVNHRAYWYNAITEYNSEDHTKLAKEILRLNDIYVGIRNEVELQACIKEDLFDLIIGIFDPRKALEPNSSNTININKYSDIIIPNVGTLEDLTKKVSKLNL